MQISVKLFPTGTCHLSNKTGWMLNIVQSTVLCTCSIASETSKSFNICDENILLHHHGRSRVSVLAYGAASGSSSTSNSVPACSKATVLCLTIQSQSTQCKFRPGWYQHQPQQPGLFTAQTKQQEATQDKLKIL